MKILFTGASSFTGYWFVQALHAAGHQVVAPLRSHVASYTEGARAIRVRELSKFAEIVENCPFGSPPFLALCASRSFDVLCHHAARVGDYKSPDFDILGAAEENTLNLPQALAALKANGLVAMLLTGSVFEANEGAGTEPLVAFSPYGESKTLTAQIAHLHAKHTDVRFGKFVIPNVFGPLQEARFYDFILNKWKGGETPRITTPDLVRDHMHVDLLALTYVRYVEELIAGTAPAKLNPSLYTESMAIFTERTAKEMRSRTPWACTFECSSTLPYTEPLIRVNTDSATAYITRWNESAAWDALAGAYRV